MSVTCQICGQEFPKMITNTHLKAHGMTVPEYQKIYGKNSTTSEEYRASRSAANTGENNPNYNKKWSQEQRDAASELIRKQYEEGRVTWNKDMVIDDPEILKNVRDGIARREEKYSSGVLTRTGHSHSEETKSLLRIAQEEYAKSHPEEMSARAHKRIEALRADGKDLAFFRGKSHSVETKKLLSTISTKTNELKREVAIDNARLKISECDLTLMSDIAQSSILELRCNKCSTEFSFHRQIFTPSKFRTDLCPTCYPRTYRVSKAESEIFDFVKSIAPDAQQSYRNHYHEYELDVFVPSMNIGFEYDGLYWHSDTVVDKSRIVDKSRYWLEQGIRVFNIFEDEWISHKELVLSRIKNILKCTEKRLYARQCDIKEIDSKTASEFCDKNHLMGSARSNVRLGLFFEGNLVSVMTFSKSNLSRRVEQWEINRFCSVLNTTVVGGASRLFKQFIATNDPSSIVSYADTRWSDGELYKTLGFDKVDDGVQNYWYFLPNDVRRIHRYTLRKTPQDDQSLTEYENRAKQGYLRTWDRGSSKWLWQK